MRISIKKKVFSYARLQSKFYDWEFFITAEEFKQDKSFEIDLLNLMPVEIQNMAFVDLEGDCAIEIHISLVPERFPEKREDMIM